MSDLFNAIKSDLDSHREVVEAIRLRRQKWNDETKRLLLTTLGGASDGAEELRVDSNEHSDNLNSVFLAFTLAPSGIVKKDGGTWTAFTKHSAYLGYSQGPSGTVIIYISYPYIETLQERLPIKTLRTVEPAEITEATIIDDVKEFLKEMVNYEKQSAGNGNLKISGFASLHE